MIRVYAIKPFLSIQTYFNANPIQLAGSAITTTGALFIANDGTGSAIGKLCPAGVGLCVGAPASKPYGNFHVNSSNGNGGTAGSGLLQP